MANSTKWVCTEDPTHVFDEDTEDHFCPLDPAFHGFLIETSTGEEGDTGTPPPPPPSWPEVGLCVILMDASSSMTEPAFAGSPLTRMQLVATYAASGIFELERMQNNPYAFVAGFKFDDRVELMFVDTVSNLLSGYGRDVKKFAAYLHGELKLMQQGTDINQALQKAYEFVDSFIKREVPGLSLKQYKPMKQRILKNNSVEAISIPNIRVLMYTDGMQHDSAGNKELLPNPFREHPLPELNHDVLIGAFIGQDTDEGCTELRELVSLCPRHGIPQFFLFNSPTQMNNMKNLFRMASGASGFCPKCLENQLGA